MNIKMLFILTVFFICLYGGNTFASTMIWNPSQVPNQVFNDGEMPDEDNYGNENVWYYQSAESGSSFDPATYSNLSYWDTSILQWRYTDDTGDGDYYAVYYRGFIHPGYDHDTVLKFVAPISGYFDINIGIDDITDDDEDEQTTNDGQRIYIQVNSDVIINYPNPTGGETEFNLSDVYLNQNDIVALRVNKNENNGCDWVVIDYFTLQTEIPDPVPIPEPATIIMFGLALIGSLKIRNKSNR